MHKYTNKIYGTVQPIQNDKNIMININITTKRLITQKALRKNVSANMFGE